MKLWNYVVQYLAIRQIISGKLSTRRHREDRCRFLVAPMDDVSIVGEHVIILIIVAMAVTKIFTVFATRKANHCLAQNTIVRTRIVVFDSLIFAMSVSSTDTLCNAESLIIRWSSRLFQIMIVAMNRMN